MGVNSNPKVTKLGWSLQTTPQLKQRHNVLSCKRLCYPKHFKIFSKTTRFEGINHTPMKNLTILVLYFFPLFSFSQTYTPVSVKTTLFNCVNDGITSQRTIIDSVNIYGKTINSTQIYAGNPDTSFTFYYYNSNHQTDSIIYKFKKYNQWFKNGFSNFQYSSNDSLVNVVSWDYQFNDTVIVDSIGHSLIRNFDATTLTLHSETSTFHSSLGWSYFQEVDSIYDNQGRLSKLNNFLNFSPFDSRIFEYLSNDSLLNTYYFHFVNGIAGDTTRYDFHYNPIGNLDSITSYLWVQNMYSTPRNLTLYSYDSMNRLIQITGKEWSSPISNWCNCQLYLKTYTYNNSGLLSIYQDYDFPSDNYFYYFYDTALNLDSTGSCHYNYPQGSMTCTGCSKRETILSLPVGLDAIINERNIHIFPNPSSEILTVELGDLNSEIDQYQITDMTGRIVLSNLNLLKKSLIIDVSTLSSGMYIISFMHDGQQRFTTRVIKA